MYILPHPVVAILGKLIVTRGRSSCILIFGSQFLMHPSSILSLVRRVDSHRLAGVPVISKPKAQTPGDKSRFRLIMILPQMSETGVLETSGDVNYRFARSKQGSFFTDKNKLSGTTAYNTI